MALASALLALLIPFTASPALAAGRVAPAIDGNGFALWYEDDAGQRVDLCLDAPECAGALSSDMTPPDGEAFYWNAEADLGVPDAARSLVIFAAEAAFDGDNPITFGRMRMVVTGGLEPFGQYTLETPWGPREYTANGDGAIVANNGGNEDLGCAPAAPGETCNFGTALQSPIFGGFLKADNAPAGFLGDGATESTVTGSPLAFNSVRLSGPGVDVTQDRFIVTGRLAAGVRADKPTVSFGDQPVNTSSLSQTVEITNSGTAAVTLDADASLSDATDFSLDPGTCLSGTELPDGVSCTVQVTFNPLSTGAKNATVTIPHDGDSTIVSLSGTGIAPEANITSQLNFESVGVGDSKTMNVTVENTGTHTLNVSDATIADLDSPFSVVDSGCSALAPGATCSIAVQYAPIALGPADSILRITHDASLEPFEVALSGRGIDVTKPVISKFTVKPNHFNPALRSATISFRSNEPGRADVVVKKGTRVIRTLAANKRILGSTQVSLSWNGRDKFTRLVKAGVYKVVVTARDAARNSATKSLEVLVIRK